MGTTQPIRKDDELYSFRMYYADEKPNVRNYTLIVLGLNTALRIGDLLSLKWSSVYNFQFQSFYDHILIHEQKTGKRNNVLLNATAKDALQAYFNERSPEEGEYIFRKAAQPLSGIPDRQNCRSSHHTGRLYQLSFPQKNIWLPCMETGNPASTFNGYL